MNTRSLVVVEGTCPQSRTRSQRDPVGGSIHRAIDAGFRIGRRVRIGRVPGSVIGYNIANSGRFGGAAESITAAKQRRVLIAAQGWLGGAGRRFRDAPCRFDAVLLDALDPARVTWLPGAFDAG